MYARIARWEGAQADALRRMGEDMKARAATGPPEGVPSTGFTLLIDADSGRSMAIGFFDTEEDLRKGDEALNAMSHTGGPEDGRRVSVEMYEVAVDLRT